MCGRFVLAATTDELAAEFAVAHIVGPSVGPSWNIAPTQPVRIIRLAPSEIYDAPALASHPPAPAPLTEPLAAVRELRTTRWGLVPSWAKDPSIGSRMINARSETVAVKPAFRVAAARRRCLIPADGYYEWTAGPGGKTPFYLHDPDGARLALAGLYEIWRDPVLPADDPDALTWTCTIITRAAPDELGHIHDRSPVVVPAELQRDWLDCGDSSGAEAEALLGAMPPPRLAPREVGRAVGNVRNNVPGLIAPVRAEPPGPADALF